jgi:hypothetical protein
VSGSGNRYAPRAAYPALRVALARDGAEHGGAFLIGLYRGLPSEWPYGGEQGGEAGDNGS